LEFIEFRLHWEGRLNRRDLIECFGISAQQASADIARYEEAAPGNITYDRSTKSYLRSEAFEPKFIDPTASDYLTELRLTAEQLKERPWIGEMPSIGMLPSPYRAVDWRVLRDILSAIRARHAIQVLYQSFSRPEPEWRRLSPHALGFDGVHWHMRAWCHRTDTFKNFSLSRMFATRSPQPSLVNPQTDVDWHETIELTIVADHTLSPGQQRAVELEYGMKEGKLLLDVKRSFLLYALRRLGLDVPEEARPTGARRLKLLDRQRIFEIAGIGSR
jgi:hypothetical protein